MAKFNTGAVKAKVTSPVTTTDVRATNHNGGEGWLRDPKSELFLLGVSSFNEDTFYESAGSRSDRIRSLVAQIVEDDKDWIVNFVGWLRANGNMRSVSIMIALEAAHAMIAKGITGARSMVASSMQRADEPGEAVAYWIKTFGRKIPAAVKRGIADAAVKLYNERSILKYDTSSKTVRFADVIQLVHPAPVGDKQSKVFKFALDRRYNDKVEVPAELSMAAARADGVSGTKLRAMAKAGTLTEHMRKTAMTWENLASTISGGMDAKAWESAIPVMGYMALIRNLRNFLDAGVDRTVMDDVCKRIADPDEVAKSRQLPFRFLAARAEVQYNAHLVAALETALEHSFKNVPKLSGKTLILVDMSGSMFWGSLSGNSKMTYADAASIFGSALALSADDADVHAFGGTVVKKTAKKGTSVMQFAEEIGSRDLGGTYTQAAVDKTFKDHDRVIILTDEQLHHACRNGNYGIKNVPVYIWNLAGYRTAGAKADNVFAFGGLSDASFTMIDMVERARNAQWPWEH